MALAYDIKSKKLQDQGKKRKNNEDYVDSFEPSDPNERLTSGCLYVVADGVGGAARGERASEYAVQKVLYEYYYQSDVQPEKRLVSAVESANRDIYQFTDEVGHGRMATTLVAALILQNKLTVVNVGDSRAYLIRGGQAQQVTRDHSYVGEMVRDGSLTEEEALHSKAKNRLTRSVGGNAEVQVDLFRDIPLQPGDRILLCTDGLTRYTLRQDIEKLTADGNVDTIAQRCVDFALRNGGADNITVVVIEVLPASAPTLMIPIQRPGLPANLDNQETLTDLRGGSKRSNSGDGRLSSKEILILVVATIALVVVVISGVILITGRPTSPSQPEPSPSAIETVTVPAETMTPKPTSRRQLIAEGSQTPSFTPSTNQPDQAQANSVSASSTTILLTVSPTVIQTSSPAPSNGFCLVQIISGDTPLTILLEYKSPYNPTTYYYYNCGGGAPCTDQKPTVVPTLSNGNPSLPLNMWIKLITINQTNCTDHTGPHHSFWYIQNP